MSPPDTVVQTADFTGSLALGYAYGGPDGIFQHVQDMLGVGIGELVVVDDARWAALTAGVAPISITNPDSVEGFETGPIDLADGEVANWLDAPSHPESDLARLSRGGLFWGACVGRGGGGR